MNQIATSHRQPAEFNILMQSHVQIEQSEQAESSDDDAHSCRSSSIILSSQCSPKSSSDVIELGFAKAGLEADSIENNERFKMRKKYVTQVKYSPKPIYIDDRLV